MAKVHSWKQNGEDSEEIFVWGDDFDAILAIFEEDEAIDHHFTSVIKEVSIYFCFQENKRFWW